MGLAQAISSELVKSVSSASHEVDIVKDFLNNLTTIKLPPNTTLTSAFCHQKPYASFVNPLRYASRKKCELGDILWVYKSITSGNRTKDHRATFSQVKYSRSTRFRVERHQFEFLYAMEKDWFGCVMVIYLEKGTAAILFSRLTRSDHFSNYLLLSPQLPPKCQSTVHTTLSTGNRIDPAPMEEFEQYLEGFMGTANEGYFQFGLNLLEILLASSLSTLSLNG